MKFLDFVDVMIEYVLDMMGWMCNVVDWDDIVDLFDDVG